MTTRTHTRGFTLVELMIVVAVACALATVTVQAVKVYLSQAKTAEAKGMVGAMARAAVAAYERGTSEGSRRHQLCTSAKPVPASVPRGTKYQPSSTSGQDFQTGTRTKGWQCLKFSIHQPIYHRYTYRQGGKAVARKNPVKPGRNGFETAAQGDLDGDGKRSSIAITGRVQEKTQTLSVSPTVFVDQDYE